MNITSQNSLRKAAIGFCLALAACSVDTVDSEDVSPEAVHQSYHIKYSGDKDRTTMLATFRVGGSSGTTIRLNSPSELRANGHRVSASTYLGTHYDTTVAHGFIPRVDVLWIDQEDRFYHNRFAIKAVSLRFYGNELFPDQGYSVSFHASEIDSRDRFSATIHQRDRLDGSSEWVSTSQFDLHSRRIYFSPRSLEKLRDGYAELTIHRTRRLPLQEATMEGGHAYVEYIMAPVSIRVIKRRVFHLADRL